MPKKVGMDDNSSRGVVEWEFRRRPIPQDTGDVEGEELGEYYGVKDKEALKVRSDEPVPRVNEE